LVLQELRWELSTVTPLDFLDQLLERLLLSDAAGGLAHLRRKVDAEDARRRAETALVLAATDYRFTYLAPSLVSAASVHAVLVAAAGEDEAGREAVLHNLAQMTHAKKVKMHAYESMKMTHLFRNTSKFAPTS